jgi:protein TonB
MNDAVKHRSLPGPLREAPLPPASGRLAFKANTRNPVG